jgi:Uncharacterized conserved protein (DUF2340)
MYQRAHLSQRPVSSFLVLELAVLYRLKFHPSAKGTLTVRVIKSFSYRTYKNLVIHDLDLAAITVGELKKKVKSGENLSGDTIPYISATHPSEMASRPGWKTYRNVDLGKDQLAPYVAEGYHGQHFQIPSSSIPKPREPNR